MYLFRLGMWNSSTKWEAAMLNLSLSRRYNRRRRSRIVLPAARAGQFAPPNERRAILKPVPDVKLGYSPEMNPTRSGAASETSNIANSDSTTRMTEVRLEAQPSDSPRHGRK